MDQNVRIFKRVEEINIVNRRDEHFTIKIGSKVFLNNDGDQDFHYLICDNIVYYFAGELKGNYMINGFFYDKANVRRGGATKFIKEKDMFLDAFLVD